MLDRVLGPVERLLYRSVPRRRGGGARLEGYGRSMPDRLSLARLARDVRWSCARQTLSNSIGLVSRCDFHSGTWDVTFNTVSSFVTNTNWQYYGGETTMSYLSQMAGADGAELPFGRRRDRVAVALIRGIVGRSGKSLGNFWQDLVRTILYVLTAALGRWRAASWSCRGRSRTSRHYLTAHGVTGAKPADRRWVRSPRRRRSSCSGPTAAGSSTPTRRIPFENPTGFTNFLEMLVGPADPRGARVHVRADGRATAGRGTRSSRR